MKKTKKAPDVKSMVLIAVFAALSCIGAFIRIPMGSLPFTLQLLFTNLAGLMLGGRRGASSVLLYIFIGLVGLPVFAQGGGPGYILLPSFGYLLGMALGAFLAGRIFEKSRGGFVPAFLAGLLNIAVTYTIGTAYFAAITVFYLGGEIELTGLLLGCCVVFIPGDAISCALGASLASRLCPIIFPEKQAP